MKRKKLLLNQLINFFWTILCFTPILMYCFTTNTVIIIYILIGVSVLCGFLPKVIFNRIQLGENPKFYEKLGVKKIRNFVQDGTIINRLFNESLPGNRIIRDRNSMVKYLKTIEMYERYHFICLIFFTLISLQAFLNFRYSLGIIITAGNFLYNVCPILLQQYNKVRVLKMLDKSY